MIIAAFGQLANGKDTVCDHLYEKLPSNPAWARSAFANAVKDTFCNAFDVDREFIEKWKRISEPPAGMKMPVRQALQFIGDGFRQIVPSIWIDIALRNPSNLIISDGRYINEAVAVGKKGGMNILIYREGFINDDPNPSEAQLRPCIEWAAKNLNSGPIVLDEKSNYPEELTNFHYFIKNINKEKLFLDIEKSLIPYINKFFKS